MVRVPPLGGSQGSALALRAPRHCPSQGFNLAFPPTSRDFTVMSEFRLQAALVSEALASERISVGTALIIVCYKLGQALVL
jgi:hypothetical protein